MLSVMNVGADTRDPCSRVVAVAVLVIELQPWTDFHAVLPRDRDIPLIEEPVEIGP